MVWICMKYGSVYTYEILIFIIIIKLFIAKNFHDFYGLAGFYKGFPWFLEIAFACNFGIGDGPFL